MIWRRISLEKIRNTIQLKAKSFTLLKNTAIRSILIMTGIIVILSYLYFLFLPWDLPADPQEMMITIKRGMTPEMIAKLLKEKGVIRGENHFLWSAKLLGLTRKLQAGNYFFENKVTNYQILKKLSQGDVMTTRVTFPEGIRALTIASMVQQILGVDSTHFMNLVCDQSYCLSLGISENNLEGYLYPDTYVFYLEPTPQEIIKKMI
ncbi:endolytic transglycosylase MltG, partial [bacterium]|nr:endolytic transglycosylase MltG [bacterium]